MGSTQAQGFADAVSEGLATLEQALAFHLQSNFYPPIPLSMVEACAAAIEAYNDGDFDRSIPLPEGVTWKGQEVAPASVIVDDHHLGSFVFDPYAAEYEDIPPADYTE